jgi:hypothetical protein
VALHPLFLFHPLPHHQSPHRTSSAGQLPWDVTDPRTWPPHALARLEHRRRKVPHGAGAGAGAQEEVPPAEIEWSDHNLGIMADLREEENRRHALQGFFPRWGRERRGVGGRGSIGIQG